jgi:hypothetical protein
VIDVTILVADDRVGTIDDVAAALRDVGLRRGVALPATGVITGSVEDDAAVGRLASVPGVESVELAESMQIPPPDEPVQ